MSSFQRVLCTTSIELEPEDVSLLEKCPHFRGCYVYTSIELEPEDVSLLERCPRFRGCYVQPSMKLGPLCTMINKIMLLKCRSTELENLHQRHIK